MSGAVLVDSPVWIAHFAGKYPGSAQRLLATSVRLHEFTFGELILGSIARDSKVLNDLAKLPTVRAVSHEEVVAFVKAKRLEGSGIGWVDAHLLAAADAEELGIWTLDQPLIAAAGRTGIPVMS